MKINQYETDRLSRMHRSASCGCARNPRDVRVVWECDLHLTLRLLDAALAEIAACHDKHYHETGEKIA